VRSFRASEMDCTWRCRGRGAAGGDVDSPSIRAALWRGGGRTVDIAGSAAVSGCSQVTVAKLWAVLRVAPCRLHRAPSTPTHLSFDYSLKQRSSPKFTGNYDVRRAQKPPPLAGVARRRRGERDKRAPPGGDRECVAMTTASATTATTA